MRGTVGAPVRASSTLWREFCRLLSFAGLTRLRLYTTTVNLFVLLAFGIAIPWRRGYDFFDPVLILLYCLIALLFSAPAITDLLGTEWTDGHTIRARLVVCCLYGWAAFLAVLVLGIVTVNFQYRDFGIHVPPIPVLTAALALSFTSSLWVASCAALIAVVLSPTAAKLIIRAAFVFLLFALLFAGRWLSDDWRIAIAAATSTKSLIRIALTASAVLFLAALGPIAALRYAHKPPG